VSTGNAREEALHHRCRLAPDRGPQLACTSELLRKRDDLLEQILILQEINDSVGLVVQDLHHEICAEAAHSAAPVASLVTALVPSQVPPTRLCTTGGREIAHADTPAAETTVPCSAIECTGKISCAAPPALCDSPPAVPRRTYGPKKTPCRTTFNAKASTAKALRFDGQCGLLSLRELPVALALSSPRECPVPAKLPSAQRSSVFGFVAVLWRRCVFSGRDTHTTNSNTRSS